MVAEDVAEVRSGYSEDEWPDVLAGIEADYRLVMEHEEGFFPRIVSDQDFGNQRYWTIQEVPVYTE